MRIRGLHELANCVSGRDCSGRWHHTQARSHFEVTELESRVLELAIEWRDSKYAVEEALIRQELWRAIDKLKKERRDSQGKENEKG